MRDTNHRKMIALPIAIIALLMSVGSARATKIALIGDQPGTLPDAISLAQADLAVDKQIQFVEREQLDRILSEQVKALSGLADADRAIAVGKLVSADLLAIVQTGKVPASEKSRSAIGLDIFDAKTGERLEDVALTGSGEKITGSVESALRAALTKDAQHDTRRSVCLVDVRNVDLPDSMDGACTALGGLVLRAMIDSPRVAILERSRLGDLNREHRLDPSAESKLKASLVLISMDVARDPDKGADAIRVTAILTDVSKNDLGHVSVEGRQKQLNQTVGDLSAALLKKLDIPAGKLATADLTGEAARFYYEGTHAFEQSQYEQAVTAAEAAHALNPENSAYEILLAKGLINEGVKGIGRSENARDEALRTAEIPYSADPPAKLEYYLNIVRRGTEEMLVVAHYDGATVELSEESFELNALISMIANSTPGNPYRNAQWSRSDAFKMTYKQLRECAITFDNYRRYEVTYEEPAAREATKDLSKVENYTQVLNRILSQSFCYFSKSSNEYTDEALFYYLRYAKPLGRFMKDPGYRRYLDYQLLGVIPDYDTFSTYWGGRPWNNRLGKWDKHDLDNFQQMIKAAEAQGLNPTDSRRLLRDMEGVYDPTEHRNIPYVPAAEIKLPKNAQPLWQSQRALIDLKSPQSKWQAISQPYLENGQLYLAALTKPSEDTEGEEVQALRIDLATGQVGVFGQLPAQGNPELLISTIHSDNYLLAFTEETSGAFVLSLIDHSAMFLSSDRFGSDYPYIAANIGNDLFVATGARSMLVDCNMQSHKLTTLASGQRQDKQSALDDCLPWRVEFMIADAPRQRIVFFVRSSHSGAEQDGLWEYSLKTRSLRRLMVLHVKDSDSGARYFVRHSDVENGTFRLEAAASFDITYSLSADAPMPPARRRGLEFVHDASPYQSPTLSQWEKLYGDEGDRTLKLRVENNPVLKEFVGHGGQFYAYEINKKVIIGDSNIGIWELTLPPRNTNPPARAQQASIIPQSTTAFGISHPMSEDQKLQQTTDHYRKLLLLGGCSLVVIWLMVRGGMYVRRKTKE